MSLPESFTPRRMRVAHPVVHLREEPSNSSERVSQTLLGHLVVVHREQDGWGWVETDDTYRGWADLRWLRPDEPRYELNSVIVSAPLAEVRMLPQGDASLLARVSQRAVLCRASASASPPPANWVGVCLPYTDAPGEVAGYVYSSALVPLTRPHAPAIASQAAQHAEEFRGTPYVWGGSSAFGLDCSGLVQLCYRLAGVILRRDADLQRDDPRFIPALKDELLPGDLVFFGRPDRITHVGIHRGPGEFIHSAGGAGVIVSRWGDDRYSPGFVDARRLDPARAGEPVTRFESETR